MQRRLTGLVIVLILAIAVGLLNHKDVLLKENKLQLHRFSEKGYELKCEMAFQNNNWLSSTLKQAREDVFINGEKAGELDYDFSLGIPGRKTTVIPVSIRLYPEVTDLLFLSDSSHSKQFDVEVKGEVTFSNIVGGGTIPVNHKQTLHVE